MSDASTQARDEKVTVADGMPPSVEDEEEILPETDAGALARALDALAASNVEDDESVTTPPVADPPSSAEPHSGERESAAVAGAGSPGRRMPSPMGHLSARPVA